MSKLEYAYFVAGHAQVLVSHNLAVQGVEPFIVPFDDVITSAEPVISDKGLEAIRSRLRVRIGAEVIKQDPGFQVGDVTIRAVSFLHAYRVDGNGELARVYAPGTGS